MISQRKLGNQLVNIVSVLHINKKKNAVLTAFFLFRNKIRKATGCLSCGFCGGDDEIRTHYLLNAIQALSQLSYAPAIYTSFPHHKLSVKRRKGELKKNVDTK